MNYLLFFDSYDLCIQPFGYFNLYSNFLSLLNSNSLKMNSLCIYQMIFQSIFKLFLCATTLAFLTKLPLNSIFCFQIQLPSLTLQAFQSCLFLINSSSFFCSFIQMITSFNYDRLILLHFYEENFSGETDFLLICRLLLKITNHSCFVSFSILNMKKLKILFFDFSLAARDYSRY